MSDTSIQVVSALLIGPDHRILLGRRASWKKLWPNQWDSIGGHIEPGETPEDTLQREVLEEIGVLPTRWQWLETVSKQHSNLHELVENHIFAVSGWTGGEPRMTCDEHTELGWFTLAEIEALPNLVDSDYLRLIQQALAS